MKAALEMASLLGEMIDRRKWEHHDEIPNPRIGASMRGAHGYQ
jgi:hypothetical protein